MKKKFGKVKEALNNIDTGYSHERVGNKPKRYLFDVVQRIINANRFIKNTILSVLTTKKDRLSKLVEIANTRVMEQQLNNYKGLGADIYNQLVNKTPAFKKPFPKPSHQVLKLLEISVAKLDFLGFINVEQSIPASGTDDENMTLHKLKMEVLNSINTNGKLPSQVPPTSTPIVESTPSLKISAVPNIDYLVLAFIILEYNKTKTKTKTKIETKTGDKQLTLEEEELFKALDTPNCSLFAVWIMGLIDKQTLIVLTVLMSIQNINSETKNEASISQYMKNIMVMEGLMDEPEHDIYIHIPETELDQPNTVSMMKSLVSQIVSPKKKVFMRIFEYKKNGYRIPHVCVVEHISDEVIQVYDPQVSLFNSDYGTPDKPILFEVYLTLAIKQDYDTLIFNVNGEYSGDEWQYITLADYDVFESKVLKTKIPNTEQKQTLELLEPFIQQIPDVVRALKQIPYEMDITVGLKTSQRSKKLKL